MGVADTCDLYTRPTKWAWSTFASSLCAALASRLRGGAAVGVVSPRPADRVSLGAGPVGLEGVGVEGGSLTQRHRILWRGRG